MHTVSSKRKQIACRLVDKPQAGPFGLNYLYRVELFVPG